MLLVDDRLLDVRGVYGKNHAPLPDDACVVPELVLLFFRNPTFDQYVVWILWQKITCS